MKKNRKILIKSFAGSQDIGAVFQKRPWSPEAKADEKSRETQTLATMDFYFKIN